MYYAWIDSTGFDFQPGETVAVRLKRRKTDGTHEYYDPAAKQWVANNTVPLTPLRASSVNGQLVEWSDWFDWPEVNEPTAMDYIHPRHGLLLSEPSFRRKPVLPRAVTMVFA